MIYIEELTIAIGKFISMLLRPENVATLTIVGGLLYKGVKLINKKLDTTHDATVSALSLKLDNLESSYKESTETLQKDVLRLQILDGIESNRLSVSEVLLFFDRYKTLGGNSFVEDRVKKYVKESNVNGKC